MQNKTPCSTQWPGAHDVEDLGDATRKDEACLIACWEVCDAGAVRRIRLSALPNAPVHVTFTVQRVADVADEVDELPDRLVLIHVVEVHGLAQG